MSRLGQFVDEGRTFEVLTPDPPVPWYNYLFNKEYVAYVSQCGQGESQCLFPVRSPVNRGQRFFYLRDNASGAVYGTLCRPSGVPPQRYVCRHSLAFTDVITRFDGVAVDHRVFVPLEGETEIWMITLRNEGTGRRDLSFFSYVPLFDAGGTFGVWSRFEPRTGILFARKIPYFARMDEYPGVMKLKQVVGVFADVRPAGFDGSDQAFLGGDVPAAAPRTVAAGSLTGSAATNQSNCAAFQWNLRLEPGGEFRVNLFQTAADPAGEDGVRRFRERAARPGYAELELARVQTFWDNAVEDCRIETPDDNFNAAVNCWVKKQLYFMAYTHRMNPSPCTRNELQDMQGISLMDPEWARANLDRVLAFQRRDGYLGHSIALNDQVVLGGICVLDYRDGHTWLPPAVAAYVNQTGDFGYLRRRLPFVDSPAPAPVAEHVRLAFEYVLNDLGAHGIPRLGAGDWDDPLSGPGWRGRGESSWIAMAAVYAARQYLPVAAAAGDGGTVAGLDRLIRRLDANLNEKCWDGSWYVRGFDDDGEPFGCSRDREGRMYLNVFSWAVLSGVARGERLESVLRLMDEVFDTPCGPYTVEPPFTTVDPRIGKLTVKRPGTMENGSVYCHAAAFKAMADCVAGRGTAAARTLARMLGTNPENPPAKSFQPPLFIPNFYVGPHDRGGYGRSSLYNSTGAAAWFFRIAVEHLAGVRPEPGGLRLDPCIPAAWRELKLRRRLRGRRVDVAIRNPEGVERGVRSVTVNGAAAGSLVPLEPGAGDLRIELVMGPAA